MLWAHQSTVRVFEHRFSDVFGSASERFICARSPGSDAHVLSVCTGLRAVSDPEPQVLEPQAPNPQPLSPTNP